MKIDIKLISLLIIFALLSSCSEPTKVDTNMGACEILANHPNWKTSLQKAEKKYGLPPALAMGLIYQESRFNANAKNPNSTAYGYSQAIDATWKHFQQEVKANARRDNFDDSVQFVGWYMAQLSKSLKLKMTDSYNLYMAYMLGATGFKRYKAGTFKDKVKIQEDKKLSKKVKNYTNLYASQLKKCKF